jgi:DNA-directed RNA polymerase subunit H
LKRREATKTKPGDWLKDVDISKHKLVPKHAILNDAEKQLLLKQYNITLNHLPRILLTDPMVKLLDAKVGDVVKITRDSPTAGKALYYRVVVRGAFK